MRNLFCKIFGHKYDPTEQILFEIELKAINREQLKPVIECQRCGFLIKGYCEESN